MSPLALSGQEGGGPPRGAGPQHQEPGLLVQADHTHRVHHRGGQEFLHAVPEPVSASPAHSDSSECVCVREALSADFLFTFYFGVRSP